MKNFKLVLSIAFALTFAGCQKQPTASFSTDKKTYIAGETIHCYDFSTDAYIWKWTMFDGSTYTSEYLNYVIDSKAYGNKTIALEVAS